MERTDLPPFELYYGPVDSPQQYVNFCVHQGRQTGKTHMMLMSIPDEPIVIIVHNQTWAKHMTSKLRELRPDYNVKNITFVSYDERGDYYDKLRGTTCPVYVDNAVLDVIQYNYVRSLNVGRG